MAAGEGAEAGPADRDECGASRRVDRLVLLAMLLPNAVWVALDRRLWVSDEGWYGLAALGLEHTLRTAPHEWPAALLAVAPKPPMLPWLAQFFVPLGRAIGAMDPALVALTLVASSITLILVYESVRRLHGRRSIAIVTCLALASAPVFAVTSKTFYVQGLQTTGLAWLVFVMARAPRRDPLATLLEGICAGSFALCTMLSSPSFGLLPVLVAAVFALRPGAGSWRLQSAHLPWLGLGLLLLALTIAWLLRNGEAAVTYAGWSYRYFFGGALLEAYPARLAAWLGLLGEGFLITPWLWVPLVAVAIVAVARPATGASGGFFRGRLWPVLLIAQTGFVIALFASSAHQTYRYALPLTLNLVLVLGWCLRRIDRPGLTLGVGAVFLVQLGVVQLGQFGLTEWQATIHRIGPLQRVPPRAHALSQAIATVAPEAGDPRGLLATGELGLYNMNAGYYAAATDPGRVALEPRFDSVEFRLTGSPRDGEVGAEIDAVWARIAETRPLTVVTTSEALRSAARRRPETHGWASIVRGTAEIAERVAASARFERVGLPDHPEIEVYRSVEPSPVHED